MVYNNQHCARVSPLELQNIMHVSLIYGSHVISCPWSRVVIELAPEHYEICGLVRFSNFESTECGKVQNNPILHALGKLLLSTTPSHAIWSP